MTDGDGEAARRVSRRTSGNGKHTRRVPSNRFEAPSSDEEDEGGARSRLLRGQLRSDSQYDVTTLNDNADDERIYLITPTHRGPTHQSKPWYHRDVYVIPLGGLFLTAAGIIFGFATPIPHDLKERDASLGRFSNVLGGVYFIAWSLSFYPQAILNYRLKSTIGMSYDYQVYNIIGFLCYSIFNCMFFFSPIVQEMYRNKHHGKNNQVQASDVFFSLHAFLLTIVTCVQIAMYRRGNQKISRFCWVVSGLCVLVGSLFAILCATVKDNKVFTWLNFYQVIANIKLAVTLIKYIPQVYLNYKRKRTDGMNIHNFLLDLTGSILSTAQLCMDSALTKDWTAITGDIAKFGLGSVGIVYDIILIVQHYGFYRKNNKQHPSIPSKGADASISDSANDVAHDDIT